jgi:uncharacterized protein YwgA
MNPYLPAFINWLKNTDLVTLDIIGDAEAQFENRFRIQKYVFLARYFGLNMHYNYNVYIHGPYSKGLAEDYYTLAEHGIFPDTNLPDTFDSEDFFTFVTREDPLWLEAASTLLSLNRSIANRGCLIDRIRNMKDHIPVATVESILNELEDRHLVHYN